MIGGMDRYFQITRCFRDEDLRADRQPEFTQVDVEMSFASPDLVYALIEPVIQRIFQCIGTSVCRAVPPHAVRRGDCEVRLGQARPALRPRDPRRVDGIRRLRIPRLQADRRRWRRHPRLRGARRQQVHAQPDRRHRRPGEADRIRRSDLGASRRAAHQFGEGAQRGSRCAPRLAACGAGADDLVLLAGGPADATSMLLGQLRLALAKRENLADPEQFELVWVTDFPLLEWSGEDGRWYSMHHPFTSPRDEDMDKLESDPGSVRAKAYDLVLNGSEIGGGSIRIHAAEMQARIFRRLGISDEEAQDALRLLPRGARVRHAAARRHRARAGPYRGHPGQRIVHPGSDSVPEDGNRGRPDGGRAVDGRRETVA